MTKMTNKIKMSKKSISQLVNLDIPYNEQMDIISEPLKEFLSEFGDYMVSDIELIKIETMINYLPLRNHYISVTMLTDNEKYNALSQSEKFDWKNNFLTPEQIEEHELEMTCEFRNKCFDWLDNQTELVEALNLTYSNEEDFQILFDVFVKYVWDFAFTELVNNK
jgi:hypothetical protein